jgi:hypothetical protein
MIQPILFQERGAGWIDDTMAEPSEQSRLLIPKHHDEINRPKTYR